MNLVTIALVDYGSGQESARQTQALCKEHQADYVRVDDLSVWSRSRCLNVGIRRAETKFVMTSDVDVVLSPHYLWDAIRLLTAAPLSVACSAMLDLPEESVEIFERSGRESNDPPLDAWKASCLARKGWAIHPSICVARTAVYRAVRGFDEYFEVWGGEDDESNAAVLVPGAETEDRGPPQLLHASMASGVGARAKRGDATAHALAPCEKPLDCAQRRPLGNSNS